MWYLEKRKFDAAQLKDRIKTLYMKHFDETEFLADVSNICWEGALSKTDDINVLVKNWSSLFSLTIDKHAPLKYLQVSAKYCPWINKYEK